MAAGNNMFEPHIVFLFIQLTSYHYITCLVLKLCNLWENKSEKCFVLNVVSPDAGLRGKVAVLTSMNISKLEKTWFSVSDIVAFIGSCLMATKPETPNRTARKADMLGQM